MNKGNKDIPTWGKVIGAIGVIAMLPFLIGFMGVFAIVLSGTIGYGVGYLTEWTAGNWIYYLLEAVPGWTFKEGDLPRLIGALSIFSAVLKFGGIKFSKNDK